MTSSDLRSAAAAIAGGHPAPPVDGWSASPVEAADGTAQGVVLTAPAGTDEASITAQLGPLQDLPALDAARTKLAIFDPGDTPWVCRVVVEFDGAAVRAVTLTRDIRLDD